VGKFGDAVVVGAKFGDAGIVGLSGRKFGNDANESVRFDDAVANNASKSGDVEAVIVAMESCVTLSGQIAPAPSSTSS
jgi:hypothetical protein